MNERTDNRTAWSLAFIALVPMIAVYGLHFALAPPGSHPTGFLQYDQLYYMSIAETVAANGFWPFYGLPFSPDDLTPRIYFQPQAVALAVLTRVTGAAPGVVYAGFGLAAGLLMFRAAIALYQAFGYGIGDTPGRLTCLCFLWGGGFLAVSGWLAVAVTGTHGLPWASAAFILDPFHGTWFLNLGRNAYYATEAYYHTLFFLAAVALLRGRLGLCVMLAAILSASHPFTGLELLLVLTAFTCAERILVRNPAMPAWTPLCFAGMTLVHVAYYLVFLTRASAEHRLLYEQWSLPWILPAATILTAYGAVLAIAIARLASSRTWPRDPSGMPVRLAVVWFGVAFALANHEWFMAPRQPLHFTHGYIWIPLALLALPAIEHGFRRIRAWAPGFPGHLLMGALLVLILSDNLSWMGWRYSMLLTRTDKDAVYVTEPRRQVLTRLSDPDMTGRLLVSDDPLLGYLATAYGPRRVWFSHVFNTPGANRRRREIETFKTTGVEPDAWKNRPLALAMTVDAGAAGMGRDARISAGFVPAGQIGGYDIMIRDRRPEGR